MQKLTDVKKRMKAISEIKSIAQTMATVASAKLSRTRSRAAGMRLYAQRMREVLQRQQLYLRSIDIPIEQASPFFVVRPTGKVLLIHLSGDRGMCGNYNVAVNRLALGGIEEWLGQGIEVLVMTRGLKGEGYLRKHTDAEIVPCGTWPRAGVTDEIVGSLHSQVIGLFEDGSVDEVWCAYTRFYTPIHREPALVRLLPIRPDALLSSAGRSGLRRETARDADVACECSATDAKATRDWADVPVRQRWSYEPRFSDIVLDLVRMYLRVQVEDVLLESYASEQGARMITMEEATERATKRLHECRVMYNRLRREFITTDLLGVLFASRVRKEARGART